MSSAVVMLVVEGQNNTPSQAPSQQITRLVRGYQKVVMGTLVAARIGVPKLRNACPHFDQWVGRLEGLGVADEQGCGQWL